MRRKQSSNPPSPVSEFNVDHSEKKPCNSVCVCAPHDCLYFTDAWKNHTNHERPRTSRDWPFNRKQPHS